MRVFAPAERHVWFDILIYRDIALRWSAKRGFGGEVYKHLAPPEPGTSGCGKAAMCFVCKYSSETQSTLKERREILKLAHQIAGVLTLVAMGIGFSACGRNKPATVSSPSLSLATSAPSSERPAAADAALNQ